MAAKIFISYRRDDSAGYAGRVHDQLVEKLGSNVFMDVDGIPLGSNFVKALNDEVAKCSALLAVIGPDWLDARDQKGQRRLDNPHDFVRVEIGAALNRQIPVIPILLEGTTVPSADQLPLDLQELSLRNGIHVHHESFRNDMDRLVRGLKAQLRRGNWRDIFSSARDERTDRGEPGWTKRALLAATCTAGTATAVAYIIKIIGDENREEKPPPPPPQTIRTSPQPTTANQIPIDAITTIAAVSSAIRVSWGGRGRAPAAYIKGMAVMFAVVLRKLAQGDPAAVEMSRATSGDSGRDALAHYASQFAALGMRNDISGIDTLRHLFVLLIGLGMRASSGRYCEGYDRSASNTSAESAEAGLFQMTWDARGASRQIPRLLDEYQANGGGYREIFSEGVTPRADDLDNYGSGTGLLFQQLCKERPGFAVETAAVGLRNLRTHWGAINRREVELRPECDDMLQQVQSLLAGR
jgi:hypothetical protein